MYYIYLLPNTEGRFFVHNVEPEVGQIIATHEVLEEALKIADAFQATVKLMSDERYKERLNAGTARYEPKMFWDLMLEDIHIQVEVTETAFQYWKFQCKVNGVPYEPHFALGDVNRLREQLRLVYHYGYAPEIWLGDVRLTPDTMFGGADVS